MKRRKNKNIAKQELDQKLKQLNFTLVGSFISMEKSVEFLCSKGHTWKTRPRRLNECPICNREQRVLKKSDINNMLEHRNIILIGDYTNLKIKTTFKCKLNHTWESKPNNVLYAGNSCPHCAKNAKHTKESINEKLKPRKIKLISEYKNAQTKCTLICDNCNNVWDSTINNILSGRGCPNCARERATTKMEIVEENLNKKGIKLIGDYKNMSTKTDFICPKGHIWSTSPRRIINGRTNCPICSRTEGNYGLDYGKPAILYYIKILEKYYKIGITTRKIEQRFSKSELQNIEILNITNFETALEAYIEEQKILNKFSKFLYSGPPILKQGNTEIFIENILKI